MNAEIICIGSEYIKGTANNNGLKYLLRELPALGISIQYQTFVGESAEQICTAAIAAKKRSNMIIVVGSDSDIGQDYTVAQIIAKTLRVELAQHNDAYALITERLNFLGAPNDELAERLSMLPQKCALFYNDIGIVPGCAFASGHQLFIVLPKNTAELIAMFNESIVPFLERSSKSAYVSHKLNTFGLNESSIHSILSNINKPDSIDNILYYNNGECSINVISRAASKEEASAALDIYVDALRNSLGSFLYSEGNESLEQAIINLMSRKQITLSSAESCTAGLVSKRLTDVPGSSEVFICGVAAYSNMIKQSVLGVKDTTLEKFGAVSNETAAAMAVGVRNISGTTLSVSTTGIAGPGGGTEYKPVGLVHFALCDGSRVWIESINMGSECNREFIRSYASSYALDFVRRYLTSLPDIMPGSISLTSYKTDAAFVSAVTPNAVGGKKKRRGEGADVMAVVNDDNSQEQNGGRFKDIFQRRK